MGKQTDKKWTNTLTIRITLSLLLVLAVAVLIASQFRKGSISPEEESEIVSMIQDEGQSEVIIDADVMIRESLVITGNKTLTGSGSLVVSEEMEDQYAIVVADGAVLTVDGITVECQNHASGIYIDEGGELVMETAFVHDGVLQNIYNEGTLQVKDGELSYSGDCNLVNKGTVSMSGGVIRGNGGSSEAVVYNEGTFKMTGGTIDEGIACDLYLAKGSDAEISGGYITGSGRDGVYVQDGASLKISDESTRISNCGMNGIVNGGTAVIEDVVMMGNGGNHIENQIGGDLTLNGGQYMSAMAYGINNRGTMHMNGGSITSSSYSGISNKGTCYISGGEISYNNWRGISNKSGASLYVEGDVVFKANTSSHITNDLAGYVEVEGVTLNAGGSNQVHNRGTFYLSDCELVDAGSNAVNNVGGLLIMRNTNVDTTVTNNGIYMTGGEVRLYDCTVSNVASRAIQNAGAKFYAENLVIDNAMKSSIGNKENSNTDKTGSIEIVGLTVTNPQGVVVNSEGKGSISIKNGTISKTKYSTGIRIYDGTVTLDNLMMNGTTAKKQSDSIHEIYMTGGILNINNCTIHDTDSRAIQNAGGTVYAKNLTVYNTGGTALGNKAYEGVDGNMTITGLNVSASKGNHLINECNGTVTVTDGNFGVAVGSSAIKIAEDTTGRMVLRNCKLAGTQLGEKADDSIHAIYPLGGSLDIYNSEISDVQSRAIQNKGCKITIDGLTITNCGGVAIGNEVGAAGQKADITASNLNVKDTLSSSVVNNAAGTNITIQNSILGLTPKTNVSATAGSITLKDTTVLGTTGDDRASISVSAGAAVTIQGDASVISNPSFRAVVNHGSFTLEGGTIKNAVSSGSAGAVYTDGAFTMTGGTITGNESASVGGAVSIVKTANGSGSMRMSGGTITGNTAKTKGGAICVGADTTCTITGGTIGGNTAGKTGNNIYDEGTLILGGSLSVENIFLAQGKYITIDSRIGSDTILSIEVENGCTEGRRILIGANSEAVADAANKVRFINSISEDLYLGEDGVMQSNLQTRAARIGETYYATLAGAFAAAPADGNPTTVVLLEDVNVKAGIVLNKGQNIILTDDGTMRTIKRDAGYTTGRLFTLSADSRLTIKGSSGSDDHITLVIDGNDDQEKVKVTNSQLIAVGTGKTNYSNAVLTLENGVALQNNNNGYGGAVVTYGTFVMNGGMIRDNRSYNDNGGAVGVQTTGTMIMNGGTITGNSTNKNSGAIHVNANNINSTALTITGGSITGNKADGYGGAATAQSGVVITGGNITGNTAKTSGSAGLRISGEDIMIGKDAVIDELWLGRDRKIILNETLTGVEDGSILLTLESGYIDGLPVLSGSGVAGSYQKFALPASASNVTIGADGCLHVDQSVRVARIGDTYYGTLASAFAAVPTNGTETTIVLVADVSADGITLLSGQNVILTDDGTTRTIKRDASYTTGRLFTVNAGAHLTLRGSSGSDDNITLIIDGNDDLANVKVSNSQLIAVGTGASNYSGAELTLESGAALQNNNNGYGGAIVTYGSFVMNGGVIRNNRSYNDNGGAVGVQTTGTMTMNGGTITGNSTNKNSGAIHVNASNKNSTALTITGGSITGNTAGGYGGAATVQSGVVITGGNITGNTAKTAGTAGFRVSGKDLTIGKDAVVDEIWLGNGRMVVVDGVLSIAGNGSILLTMEAGYTNGLQVLSGSKVADSYQKFALPASASNVTIGVDGCLHVDQSVRVARIGDTYYGTLASAFAAAPTNGTETTIVLVADVSADGITLLSGQNVILTDDGTARTIKRDASYTTGRLFTVNAGAHLTLRGSSGSDDNITLIIDGNDDLANVKVSNSQLIAVGTGASNYSGAELTLESGAALQNNNNGYGGAIVTYGSFVMNGGVIRNNRSYNDNGGAVGVQTTGTMTMNGGTITGNSTNKNSGAIHVNASNKNSTALTITGGSITGNTAGGYGGAGTVQSKAVITGGSITGNTAKTAGTAGFRVSGKDITIREDAVIDEIWLGNGRMVVVDGALSKAGNGSILLTMEAGYTNGLQVLSGSKVADNYQKFALLSSASNVTIGADGCLIVDESVKVARIGSTSYGSLAEAFAAVPTDGSATTIVLMADVSSNGIALVKGQNVILTDDGTARTIKRDASYTTGRLFTLPAGAQLTLRGSSGSDDNITLVIDGNDNQANVKVSNSQLIAVGTGKADYSNAALTLESGVALQNNNNGYGGAIVTYGSFVMNGGVIRNNRSYDDNGGAVGVQTTGTMTMNGGTITGNSTNKNSGAIHVNASNTNSTALTITGGSITGNTAGGYGGAGTVQSKAVITGGSITGNTAKTAGTAGFRVSGKDITIEKDAVVDEIWLGNGRKVVVDQELTRADVESILVTMEAGYTEGLQVLSGSKAADSYQKFILPSSAGDVAIDADGCIRAVTSINSIAVQAIMGIVCSRIMI